MAETSFLFWNTEDVAILVALRKFSESEFREKRKAPADRTMIL